MTGKLDLTKRTPYDPEKEEKYEQQPNCVVYGPQFILNDDEFPDDHYSLRVVDGKVIALPHNQSAHRRRNIKEIIDKDGSV